jgi:hypothetical protein
MYVYCGMVLKMAFPGQTVWNFLGNRFVEEHAHVNTQVKRNRKQTNSVALSPQANYTY